MTDMEAEINEPIAGNSRRQVLATDALAIAEAEVVVGKRKRIAAS